MQLILEHDSYHNLNVIIIRNIIIHELTLLGHIQSKKLEKVQWGGQQEQNSATLKPSSEQLQQVTEGHGSAQNPFLCKHLRMIKPLEIN